MARVKGSPKRTANCAWAIAPSRGGMFHAFPQRFKTSKRGFSAASSVGKCPLALTARRSLQVRASIQGLDGVGGADHFPDILGKGLERRDLRPGATPALADRGVFAAPFARLEGRQGLLGRCGAGGAGDVPQRRGDRLAVVVGGEVEAVARRMNEAGLDRRSGKGRDNGLGEALQPLDGGERRVLDTLFFLSVIARSQNLAPSFRSSRGPGISFVPSARTPRAIWTALFRTKPSPRSFTRRASRDTMG